MIIFKFAALYRSQETNCPNRMLVDRIMVVHVELHLGNDPAEVWDEAAEYASLIHPAQYRLGMIGRRWNFHEQRIGAWIFAHAARDRRTASIGRRIWGRLGPNLRRNRVC